MIRHSDLIRQIAAWLSVAAIFSLSACSGRAYIEPRSEVLARNKGADAVRGLQEERAAFMAEVTESEEKLLQLLEERKVAAGSDSSYRIGAGDQIELNVFEVPEMNVVSRVRESGFINLPLLGAVRAADMTENELQLELTRLLRKYIREPQVSIFLKQYGGHKISVLGAVRKSGSFPLVRGQNSLIEVISAAGGVTEKAGNFLELVPSRTSMASSDPIVRGNSGDSIEIPLAQVLGTSGVPLDVPVRGGDIVVIPEAGKVVVEGEVGRTGSYQIGQQSTLLTALAQAGGITYSAKIDEVEIIRTAKNSTRKLSLVLDLEKLASGEEPDIRLKNGDIVRVPTHMGRRLRHDTFEGITRLINFGVGGNVNLAQ